MSLLLLARPTHPAAPASAPIWKMLFDRQQALLHRRAGPAFGRTLAELGLRRETLPDLPAVARLIRQRTGWTLRFGAAPLPEAAYYAALARRELPVVSRLRTFANFDEPRGGIDLFADLFGRVPLLFEAGYAAALAEMGRVAALATTPPARALLHRFVGATFERGLVAAADGQPVFYGRALLTSAQELHAASATEAGSLRPLAGAARQLSPADPAAPDKVAVSFHLLAASWAELLAETRQLGLELIRLQRPTPRPHALAPTSSPGRVHAFAARQLG